MYLEVVERRLFLAVADGKMAVYNVYIQRD